MTTATIIFSILIGSGGLAYLYQKFANYRAQARAVKRRAGMKLKVVKHKEVLKKLSKRKDKYDKRYKDYMDKYNSRNDSSDSSDND